MHPKWGSILISVPGAGRDSLPAMEDKLSAFVAMLVKKDIIYTSLTTSLAGTKHCQIARGLGNPDISSMPRLE